MIGAFIPWTDTPRRSTSEFVGWVVAENGCHLWVGARNGSGYGHIRVAGVSKQAHVARYEREIGPIPAGLVLDHFVCDTPQCCNPLHVRPVTSRENTMRGRGACAQNARKTHCPQGHPLAGDNLVKHYPHRTCLTCYREGQRLARRWLKRKSRAKAGDKQVRHDGGKEV